MVYLYYMSCSRYTILVGNLRFDVTLQMKVTKGIRATEWYSLLCLPFLFLITNSLSPSPHTHMPQRSKTSPIGGEMERCGRAAPLWASCPALWGVLSRADGKEAKGFFFFFNDRQPCRSDLQSGWYHKSSRPVEVFCRALQLGRQISTLRPY